MASSSARRVAVVGGGVAGLQAARALRRYGFAPVIFERASAVGGVWRESYDGAGIQVPRMLYEFPDCKAPYGDYASGAEVQAYIQDFARKNDLLSPQTLRLNTAVDKVLCNQDDHTWTVHTSSGETEVFDKVVVATGLYQKPSVPQLPGTFSGKAIHSSEFVDAGIASGKDVVVVGGGKSAVDCALIAQKKGAKSVTMLFRTAHWGTPQLIAGVIPFHFVFLSRFGQALVSFYKGAWPTAPQAVHSAHSALGPVMGPVFRIVEALFAQQLGHKGEYRPKADVVADFYGGAQVLDSSLKKRAQEKKISLVKGEIERLDGNNVVLKGGKTLNADLLVFATGFQRDYSKLLDDSTLSNLDLAEDGLWLYRNILPPKIKNLAFIGAEVATISNIGTHGLQAEWLGRAWSGKFGQRPSEEVMQQEVEQHKAFSRRWMPSSYARANLVLLHQTHYHDTLCKDMGVPWRRKSNPLAEIFVPYGPADYASVFSKE